MVVAPQQPILNSNNGNGAPQLNTVFAYLRNPIALETLEYFNVFTPI